MEHVWGYAVGLDMTRRDLQAEMKKQGRPWSIAKGFDRKQDELVYDRSDHELARLVHAFKPLLQRLRDEAHRFAVSYHRKVRGKNFIT